MDFHDCMNVCNLQTSMKVIIQKIQSLGKLKSRPMQCHKNVIDYRIRSSRLFDDIITGTVFISIPSVRRSVH